MSKPNEVVDVPGTESSTEEAAVYDKLYLYTASITCDYERPEVRTQLAVML